MSETKKLKFIPAAEKVFDEFKREEDAKGPDQEEPYTKPGEGLTLEEQIAGLEETIAALGLQLHDAYEEVTRLSQKARKWKRRAKVAERRLEGSGEYLSKMKKEAGFTDTTSFDEVWPYVLAKAQKWDEHEASKDNYVQARMVAVAVEKVHETARVLRKYADDLDTFNVEKK